MNYFNELGDFALFGVFLEAWLSARAGKLAQYWNLRQVAWAGVGARSDRYRDA